MIKKIKVANYSIKKSRNYVVRFKFAIILSSYFGCR